MDRRIGIVHYKVGGTDGVSLEIDKWKEVLEEMGHQVFLCAGDLGSVEGTQIAELFHHTPAAQRLYRNSFIALSDYDESVYTFELHHMASVLERKLAAFIDDKKLDLLIPQNVWSVAMNPPAAIALARLLRKRRLPAAAHNHDFYWERVDGVALSCSAAVEMADKYLPPRDALFRHAVINSLSRDELAERKGIESVIIPNVFDFDAEPWARDDYCVDLRQRIGLDQNDLFILQATRIVPRKGIELAIDFVRALDSPARRAILQERGLYDGRPFQEDSRIVLVLAGYAVDDLTGLYLSQLKQKIAETGIEAVFIGDMIVARRQISGGRKYYSLWDTYSHADLVTYPSLWEGWGNQLLEAIRARLPILLFEYPVYATDIKPSGLEVISLGSQLHGTDPQGLAQVDGALIDDAADQAISLLTDDAKRKAMVENNLRIAQQRYSLSALKDYLAPLLGEG